MTDEPSLAVKVASTALWFAAIVGWIGVCRLAHQFNRPELVNPNQPRSIR